MSEIAERAKRLMDQVMKTWEPPRLAGGERPADIAQTTMMLAIAYLMGRDFLQEGLSDNQRRAIYSGLDLLHHTLDTTPTLEEWMEGWEAARESGQSSISRSEAKRRYHMAHG